MISQNALTTDSPSWVKSGGSCTPADRCRVRLDQGLADQPEHAGVRLTTPGKLQVLAPLG